MWRSPSPGTPSQGLHVVFPNAVDGATPSQWEEVSLGRMDTSTHSGREWVDIVSSESEDEIPPGQPKVDPSALKQQLERCLSRKCYLREKLIRADHHLTFLQSGLGRSTSCSMKWRTKSLQGNPWLTHLTERQTTNRGPLSIAEREIHIIVIN